MASSCLRVEDYTVAWISALPIEFHAAIQMLDKRHQHLLQDVKDMVYVFGSIGSVNVVLACLPAGQYGNESAAVVAADIRSRFPRLWFCLMVGIGGGVPSTNNDIRLGDIVVSQPNATSGGVIQYDLGKSTPKGFERTGSLNAPSDLLLRLLSVYQAENMEKIETKKENFASHLFNPRITKHLVLKPPGVDRLFRPEYEHIGEQTCDSCDQAYTIERAARASTVHYGTIASGNQVIKTARERDKLSEELGGAVLCFEMEAAGIMRALPCLIIRGICDYADSHKSKIWQSYAAYIAAAYAKEFFSVFYKLQPPDQAPLDHNATRKRTNLRMKKNTSLDLTEHTSESFDLVETDYFVKCHISEYDATTIHRAYVRRRCPGTTQWILNHPKYLSWHDSDATCLWLSGKLGSGKSFTTSTVIEKLVKESNDGFIQSEVVHYFFQHSEKPGLSTRAFLDSLIQQILNILEERELEYPADVNSYITKYYGRQADTSNIEDKFENIFKPLTVNLIDIIIIVDGIDECENISQILRLLARVNAECKMKIFISMREGLDVTSFIPGTFVISITESDYTEEVRTFIDWQIKHKSQERCITENEELLDSIKELLVEKADGMMLWVTLQIEDIWERCFNDAQIREALASLPKDLDETYRRCISKIQSRKGPYACEYAALILPWIQSAIQPLTMLQLRQALAIDCDNGTLARDRIPSAQTVLRSCANLIIADATPGEAILDNEFVHLVHHSFQQFFNAFNNWPSALQETHQPTENRSISLVAICLQHLLSTDYSLSVQKHTFTTVHLETSQVEQVLDSIPSFLRPFRRRIKPITMRLPSLPQKKESTSGLPAIFHYARSQWPYLTRDISSGSSLYRQFQEITLQPNVTYRLHPWQPLGQSFDSHISGLMSWSIINNHRAMFKLPPVQERLMARPEILALPTPEHGNYNMIILAVRRNAAWVFDELPMHHDDEVRKLLSVEDEDGWNGLLHATVTRALETMKVLVQRFRTPYTIFHEEGRTTGPLSVAVEARNLLVVQAILKLPTFVIGPDIYNAHACAMENGYSDVLKCIDHKASILWTDEKSERALACAISLGHSQIITHVSDSLCYPFLWMQANIDRVVREKNMLTLQLILEAIPVWRFDLIQVDSWPHTLLTTAVKESKHGLVENLSQLEIPLEWRFTAAIEALQMGNGLIAARILNKFDVTPSEEDLQRATTKAIEWREEHLLEEFLRFGVDPLPCLHRTISSVTAKILKLCLQYAPDWNARRVAGRTLLMKFAFQGNLEGMEILLESNSHIDVNAGDNYGETAISLCSAGGLCNYGCAKLLVQHGARLQTSQMVGPVVQRLMLEGLLVGKIHFPKNLLNDDFQELQRARGKKPSLVPIVHEAIRHRNFDLLRHLLQKGYRIDTQDSVRRTSLHIAVTVLGEGLEILLSNISEEKLNIDAQDVYGDSPLHLAVTMNRVDAVRLLLQHGANISLNNFAGESPYDVSERQSGPKVKALLKNALQTLEAQATSSRLS